MQNPTNEEIIKMIKKMKTGDIQRVELQDYSLDDENNEKNIISSNRIPKSNTDKYR